MLHSVRTMLFETFESQLLTPLLKVAPIQSWNLHVDDFVGGAISIEEAVKLYQDISDTLALIGMQIRNWATNNESILQSIPMDLRENKEISFYKVDKTIKTLGQVWAPGNRLFSIQTGFENGFIATISDA